jgi:hypothetical protein
MVSTIHSDGWTADTQTLRLVLEEASLAINRRVGGLHCGPRTDTRVYDIGEGTVRSNALLTNPNQRVVLPDYWTGVKSSGVVPLYDWLPATPTTVTAYDGTAQSGNTVLTEGVGADYWLEPYNVLPYHTLKLNEDTNDGFSGGQQTLHILATWGYDDRSAVQTTISANISSTTATTFTAADGQLLAEAQTVLINTEQMYITKIAANTVTVERGVNGTTAATHTSGDDVSVYEYDAQVVAATLKLARNHWRSRDGAGGSLITGEGGSPQTVAQEEREVILEEVAEYLRGQRSGGGVYF